VYTDLRKIQSINNQRIHMYSQSTYTFFIFIIIQSLIFSNPIAATFTTTFKMIKLTYFDIEGAAECVRLSLLLSGTPFEDIRVSFNDWPAMKPTTPNEQLPIMTIGDDPTVKTQSKAMLRWIGMTKSSTLYPPEKVFDIEEVIGDLEDMNRVYTPAQYMGMRPSTFGYPEGFQSTAEGKKLTETMRTTFVKEHLPTLIKRLTDKMSKHGGPFLVAGAEPTIADCLAVPMLRGLTRGHVDYIDPKCLDAYPEIVSYIKAFCALEPIKGRYTNGVY
jgi:glutathione S-transferase